MYSFAIFFVHGGFTNFFSFRFVVHCDHSPKNLGSLCCLVYVRWTFLLNLILPSKSYLTASHEMNERYFCYWKQYTSIKKLFLTTLVVPPAWVFFLISTIHTLYSYSYAYVLSHKNSTCRDIDKLLCFFCRKKYYLCCVRQYYFSNTIFKIFTLKPEDGEKNQKPSI